MKLVAGVIFLWRRGDWSDGSFVNARKRNAVE